jgi:Tol biopolymer transport system component
VRMKPSIKRTALGVVLAASLLAVPAGSSAHATTNNIVRSFTNKLSDRVAGYNRLPGVSPYLSSLQGITRDGQIVTVAAGPNSCPVIAKGSVNLKSIVVPYFGGTDPVVICPDANMSNVSTDAAGRSIAFQSDFGLTPPYDAWNDAPQVFMWTRTGVAQLTDWGAQGKGAAYPQMSGDGRTLVFLGNGNPTGGNADGNWEMFAYDLASKSFTQLTNTSGCSIGSGFPDTPEVAPSVSYDANRIAFVSDCDLTGDNPSLLQTGFVLDRKLGTTTQLADCVGQCVFFSMPSISSDGSTVAGYGETYSQLLVMTIHHLDAALADPSPETIILATNPGLIDAFLITAGINRPSLTADGKRIAFVGRIDFLGKNPDGGWEVFVLDDVAGGGLHQITDVADGTSIGTAMDVKGRTMYVYTNGNWAGKGGGTFRVSLSK